MDTNALTLCRSETLEPLLVSKEDMLVDKLVPADVESPSGKTGKCCHFSIRGYVADIRKRGRKICGPFCDSLDMSSKSLPPIIVAKFRWWECPNCFLQTRQRDKPDDDIRSLSLEDGKRDISSEGSQLGVTCTWPPIQLGAHQKTSAEVVPEIAEAGLKHLIDSGKSDPLSRGHLNNTDPGVSIFRGGGDSDFKEDISKTTTVLSHQTATSEPHKGVQKSTEAKRFVFKLQKKSNLSGLCGSETPDMTNAGLSDENATSISRRMNINCHSSTSNDKLQCSSSVNNSNDKEDDSESDMVVHISELVSRRINSPYFEASMEETLTETSNIDNCRSQLAVLSGNLNRKKTHKTRLLSDILNNVVAKEDCLAQKENMAAKEDSVLPQNEVMATKEDSALPWNEVIEPDNSNREILQGHVETVEEHLGKAIESKKRPRLSEVEEDGSSLLCVLKRRIKKAKGVKIDAHSGSMNYPDTNSEQQAGGTFSKPIHFGDSIPSIERCITNVGKNKKQHAKGRIKTVQKGFMQMKHCKDANRDSVPEGSALGTKYGDGHSYPLVNVCSKVTEHTGLKIRRKSHKKIKVMNTVTKMKNVTTVGVNTEQKTEVTTSKPLSPRHNNYSSVERANTTNNNHKKKIKGHSSKTMSRSSIQMNRHKDAIQDSVPEGNFKGSKYIASRLQPITDSGRNVHPETIVNSELLEKATLKPHKMRTSFEVKECQVNLKSFHNETANGTKNIVDSPRKQTTEPLNQKGGTDSVDGIPVEILKLLQDNWQKRHMDGHSLENVAKNTYTMSEKKIDKVSDLTSDAGDQLSAGFCKKWKNQHSQWMNHHSQSDTVGLGKDYLSVSPGYLPGQPSHHNIDDRNNVSTNAIGNAYYYKPTGGSSSELGTCNHQIKINKPGHVHEFRQQREPSPFTNEPGNGLGNYLVDAVQFCLPENQRLAKLMMNTCDKTQVFAGQVSCSGCTLSQPSVAFDFGQYRKIPSRFVHMDTHMKDHKPMSNQTREEDDRLKNMEATVQLQRWKHVDRLRTSQEIHSISKLSNLRAANGYDANVMPEVDIGRNEAITANAYNVMPPVDKHRNEAISAMNLLRLMDSGACSSESVGTSKNINVDKKLNISHNYRHGKSLWLGSNHNNDEDNRRWKQSYFLCQHESRNPSNLYRPDARVGLPVAFSVNNRIANINCSMSPFPYVDRGSGGSGSSEKCQDRNFVTSQTAAAPLEFSFSTFDDPQVPRTTNLAAQSPLSHKPGHVSHVDGTEILQPTENRTDLCVLNRNPADFTIPDDNNRYMIEYGDITSRLSCLRARYVSSCAETKESNQQCFSREGL